MNSAIAFTGNDSSSLRWALDYPVQLPQVFAARAIRSAGPLPPWGAAVVARISQLAALPSVDPGGSRPMNLYDVLDALNFLSRVMRNDTRPPWIGRLSSGGLQLAWHSGDVEVEAVFDRARHDRGVLVAVGENEWEAPAEEADSLFANVADRLSHAYLEHTPIA